MRRSRASRRRRGACAAIVGIFGIGLVLSVSRIGVAQQDEVPAQGASAPTASDEPAVGNAADYEVLRRLLGVPAPEAKPQPVPVLEVPVADVPVVETPVVEVEPPVAAAPSAPPVAKKAAPPAKKAVARPIPKASPKRVVVEAPEPKQPEAAPTADAAAPAAAPAVIAAGTDEDLPATGDVLRAGDFERWSHLLGPSAQWALLRGASIRVGPRKPIAMEAARAEATQRYHDQVRLTPDRKDMSNFVAGIPFPFVTKEDPDAGIKIILNQQSRLIVDDVDTRKMGCHLASISSEGLELERTFEVGHWRRLFYLGRLYHQPAPTWENQEGIRYRELQYPLIEPFDLKGGGWNYIRYADVGRSDDGWLYYPVTRRVRRISTAQRSQGFFGQDMDLDSTTGYAGNPAWMQWRLVGQKTMLASMHSDHIPVKWQAAPADFAADEPWEPRDVFVIEGRSLLAEYAFARRVVYVDKESWLIAYSEIYDNQGKLWKALHQTWGFGDKVRPDAGGKTFEEFYLPGYAMIDMQIDHVTRCELPLSTAIGDKGWYYNYGDAEGTTETAFDIVSLIGQNH